MFKEVVVELLVEETKISKEEINKLLEIPPKLEFGDFSFPCFQFSNPMKNENIESDVEKGFFYRKNPSDIAKHFADKINRKKIKEIEKVEAKGPYLNFFISKKILAQKVIKINSNFGRSKNKTKILIEYSSPNSNKPLHLGHLRNIALGESMARIFEYLGNKVIRVNLNNDKGMPISKTMLAYKKFSYGKTPQSENKKSDHFVGDLYTIYNEKLKEDSSLEEKARELLILQESKDKETIKLWRKIIEWVLSGYKETYKTFGIKFDKEYYESEIYESGKEIVMEGLKKGRFQKRKDGAIIINLGVINNEDLGEKVLLREDGTSVYMTQDLELARIKTKDFHPDILINVVGNEHDYHFKVLYEILKRLGNKERHYHLSYGLISLPDGKMKSREGNVVDADDIINDIRELAKKNLESRKKMYKKELDKKSLVIALAAIKYSLLKIEAAKNFMFNPNESINFEGNTGPYLQYSYARAGSILKKSKSKKSLVLPEKFTKGELQLLLHITKFSNSIENSAKNMNPAIIANYAYQLAKYFNEFYHSNPVIGSKEEIFRLKLIKSFRIVLKNSLNLLGIEVMEEM